MTPHKQRYLHKPEENIYGDCCRTSVACLLDIHPEEVPHWGHPDVCDSKKWNEFREEWLRLNYCTSMVAIPLLLETKEEALHFMKQLNPDIYYLLSGKSKTGVNHVVICLNDKIVHDPSINESGIIGPCNDGFFWVSLLVLSGTTKEGRQTMMSAPELGYMKETAHERGWASVSFYRILESNEMAFCFAAIDREPLVVKVPYAADGSTVITAQQVIAALDDETKKDKDNGKKSNS